PTTNFTLYSTAHHCAYQMPLQHLVRGVVRKIRQFGVKFFGNLAAIRSVIWQNFGFWALHSTAFGGCVVALVLTSWHLF
ncbi:MAG: hypothetical protein ACI30Q_08520, partial [Muribaculaceae bacterium]